MISPIIENLEFRLSVLSDELSRLSNQCRSNIQLSNGIDKKHLFRISQLKQEIEIIKQEINNQRFQNSQM